MHLHVINKSWPNPFFFFIFLKENKYIKAPAIKLQMDWQFLFADHKSKLLLLN